jgi:ACS family hexuronate transporter-like MFS transporter
MVFVASSTLNYMDRQLISTLAPLIMAEMHLNQTGFGGLISVFSIAYAASSLVTGWFLDRAGVNRGISIAVGWWSLAAIGTSFVQSFPGLALCRAALGIGESAGVPAVGKVNAIYLKPAERALGTAANQIGLSLGVAGSALWVGVGIVYGWRTPFLITGMLSLLWIPVWLAVSRAIPPQEPVERVASFERARRSEWRILSERSLILLVIANVLWMGAYALWSSWTTLYLTHMHNVTLLESAHYIWIPPLVSNAGGFFGGWLSWRWIRRGVNPVAARRRAVWVSAAGALVTLGLPFAPGPGWATALISASFFFVLAGSVNIYALPIDIFGAPRSGLAISALTCAFGLLQTVISPVIGYLSDHRLYTQVIWLVTAPLIASALVLAAIKEGSSRSDRPLA